MNTRPSTREKAKLCNGVLEQNGDRSQTKTHTAITTACTENATIDHNGKQLATMAIDRTRDTETRKWHSHCISVPHHEMFTLSTCDQRMQRWYEAMHQAMLR